MPRSPRCAFPTFSHPPDRDAAQAVLREVLDGGREACLEARINDRAGAHPPFVFTARPLRLAGEACVMGFGRDASRGRRAEEQTLLAKERLDLALTGSRLALWDWDLADDRVYFSEGWAAMLGGEPRESTVAWEAGARRGSIPTTRTCMPPRSPTPSGA